MQELEKATMDGVVPLQKQLVDYTASLFHEVSRHELYMLIPEKQENKLIFYLPFLLYSLSCWVGF